MKFVAFVTGALMVLALVSSQVSAQTLTILASFNGTNGQYPKGDLTLGGSTLYGMTISGAAGPGTIFSIPVSGGPLTTLASFNGTNGAYPCGDLTLSGSTLYGMAYGGGAYNDGTIFSIPVGGGPLTTLASFNGTNAANPAGALTLSLDGLTLYGMTEQGGANGYGTVFSLTLPEPSTFALLGIGSAALLAWGWWRRRGK